MARFNRDVEQQISQDMKLEFGQELGLTKPLDREYERGSLSSTEFGGVTKRLMDLGSKVFGNETNDKK